MLNPMHLCVQEMEAAAARSQLPLNTAGQVDYSSDFFGEKVFLTVSGQLNGEWVVFSSYHCADATC